MVGLEQGPIMSSNIIRRLTSLEQLRAKTMAIRWRRAVVRTDEEADTARAALRPGDGLILRRLVKPEVVDGG
jgi:hypothetical protein